MKKVAREKLLSALDMVTPGLAVGTKEILEGSASVAFKNGNMITYNDETACIYKSPIKMKGAIPARPFRTILQKLEEDTLEFEITKRQFIIKGKNKRVELSLEKKISLELKNLDAPKKWKKLPENFGDAVDYVKDCAGKDESQFELTCIHITPKYIEAFDNEQYACFFTKIKIKENLLVTARALSHVSELAVTHFSVTKAWIHFKNAAGLIFSCRRVRNRQYKDCTRLRGIKGERIQLPQNLVKGVRRAEVFSADGPDDNQITIELSPGKVEVYGHGQYGNHREYRKKVKYKGPAMAFMIAPNMFERIMKQQQFDSQVHQKALKVESTNTIFITSLNTPEEARQKQKEKAKKKAEEAEGDE